MFISKKEGLNCEVRSASISGLGPLFNLEGQLVIVANEALDDFSHLISSIQVSWVERSRLFKVFGTRTMIIRVAVKDWGPFDHFVIKRGIA